MKSYIQGLITGAVFVFAFMVLTGMNQSNYYDIDDVMRVVTAIQTDVSDIDDVMRVVTDINNEVSGGLVGGGITRDVSDGFKRITGILQSIEGYVVYCDQPQIVPVYYSQLCTLLRSRNSVITVFSIVVPLVCVI